MNYTIVSPYDYKGDFLDDLNFSLKTKRKNKFIRGAIYKIKNKICADSNIFSIFERTYLCVGIVRKIGDMIFDGVIMKQLSGEHPRQIFTLSKEQCNILHIHYEKGLEIFPNNTKFERVVESFPNIEKFNQNDFSSYPHSIVDGTVREIFIRLDDFVYKDGKKNKNKLYNKKNKKYYKLIKESVSPFNIISISGIKIKSNVKLKSKDYKEARDYNIQYDKNFILNYYFPKIDSNDVVISIILTKSVLGGFTEDGYIGIDKSLLKDKKFEDLFTIIDEKDNA